MIYLVDGTPGAGKSYFCVRQIETALAAGKTVVTNVPLSPDFAERIAQAHPVRKHFRGATARRADYYRKRTLVTRSLEEVMRVRLAGHGEGRGVVVLDEAHEWLNSRMWGKDTGRSEVVQWFSGHRHFGFDIFLVSQHIEDIDKQVRNRVEYRVRLRNLKRERRMGIPMVPFNLFAAIHELQASRTRPIVKRDFYRLDKRTAGMYSTHGLADGDVPADVIWLPVVPDVVADDDQVADVEPVAA